MSPSPSTPPSSSPSSSPTVVCVFGSGSFGTALACVIARSSASLRSAHNATSIQPSMEVRILTRRPDVAASINLHHRNPTHMSSFPLPSSVKAFTDPAECLKNVNFIVHVIPVQSSRAFLQDLAPLIPADVPIISASKGICGETLCMMDEIIPQALGRPDQPTAFVSGPTFARELMQDFPSGCVLASVSDDVGKKCSALFRSARMRVYQHDDVIGVEVGGALKNVYALAAGIADGMGWGLNTTALLVTLGCREMGQVASAMGADAATLSGLSGIGDMMLTCFGSESRNRTVGRLLGEGNSLADVLDARVGTLAGVAEGVATAPAALRLGKSKGVSTPIVAAVCAILEGESAHEVLHKLLAYPVHANGDLVVTS